jgi:hypothetical protein
MRILTVINNAGELELKMQVKSIFHPEYTPAKSNLSDICAAVEISDNNKIGRVSATWVAQNSCPSSCPHMGAGCYAETGMAGFTTARLNKAACDHPELTPAEIAQIEAAGIDTLTGKRDLRLHVVGDARTDKAAQILAAAADRYIARGNAKGKNVRVWTYTHARDTKRTSWGRISVLRSCETLQHVKAAHAAGYAAAIVIPEHVHDTAFKNDGFTFIPCPEQTGRAANCQACGLCMRDQMLHANKRVIVFAAHGQGRKKMVHLKTV